jgi:hypothetical protein
LATFFDITNTNSFKDMELKYKLKKDFEFYVQNQGELVKKYNGRVLIIHDQVVVGNFASTREAIEEGERRFGLGKFLMHKCEPGPENYTAVCHSRVSPA